MRAVQLKAGAAVAWCLLLGWIAFVRSSPVPLLALVDLGFHELGHLVMYPTPWDGPTAAMGTIAQIAVPAGLAAYFAVYRRERASAAVCLAWAATSAQGASVYIADAPTQQLELIGGEHDWAFLLERHLEWAAPLATSVRFLGGLFLLAGVAAAASTLRAAPEPAPPTPVRFLD